MYNFYINIFSHDHYNKTKITQTTIDNETDMLFYDTELI